MTKRVTKNLVNFTPKEVASRFAEFEKASNVLEDHGAVLGTMVALCYKQGGVKLVAEYFNPPLAKIDNDPKSEGFSGKQVKQIREIIRYNSDGKLTIKNMDKTKKGMIITTPEKRAKKEVKLSVAVKALITANEVINQSSILDDTQKTEIPRQIANYIKVLEDAILANNGVAVKKDEPKTIEKVA
jgi:hypothetical protein